MLQTNAFKSIPHVYFTAHLVPAYSIYEIVLLNKLVSESFCVCKIHFDPVFLVYKKIRVLMTLSLL
jgi:hypothetical protein